MILIADSHLTEQSPCLDDFFAMLERIEQTGEDVVLLGDVLDFWVGVPSFHLPVAERLLAWCEQERARRRVGLLEGNHEFYVGRYHPDCFSFWSASEWREGDLLLAHGDRVNRRDVGSLVLRLLTKNPLSRFCFGTVPGGRRLAWEVKHRFGKLGEARAKYLPEAAVRHFAERRFAQGVRRIFLGHFHQAFRYEGTNGGTCQLVPAWQSSGQIVHYDVQTDHAEMRHWREL